MGRKESLKAANTDLLDIMDYLRFVRTLDVKARKSRKLARLKPKYTADIATIDLILASLVVVRKLLRTLPKAVQ